MASIEIREVKSKKDLKAFIHFPYTLYQKHPYWVPPIKLDEKNTFNTKRNPNLKYADYVLFLAYVENKLVGRIAGIVNHKYIEKWGNKTARFGWFDFIDNKEVADALLSEVEKWAREKAMTSLVGPMGFTDLDKEGMLVEGFDVLGSMPMLYNYEYYPRYVEASGYEKDVDWLEYKIKIPNEIPEKVLRIKDLTLSKLGLKKLEYKNAKELMPYAKDLFDLLNIAYSHLYGTVDLSEDQIETYTEQYISYCDPRWTIVILDKEDKLAGFGIAMPSFSKALQKNRGSLFPLGIFSLLKAMKKVETLDLYLIGVRPELKGLGLPAILLAEGTQNAIDHGIKYVNSTGMLESNHEVQSIWKSYEFEQHKRRRVYKKLF